MGREVFDHCPLRCTLHNLPYRLGSDSITPDPTQPVYSAENGTRADASGQGPLVYSTLHPHRDRNCPDVFSLADQVGYDPVLLPDLEVLDPQSYQFCSSEPTTHQQGQNLPITLTTRSV